MREKRKRFLQRILPLLLGLLLVLGTGIPTDASAPYTAAGSDAAVNAAVATALAETKAYILNLDKNPGYDSQWFALGLARSGMAADSSYFQTFYKNLAAYIVEKKGNLHSAKYTEYSKAIVSLTATGKDARDVSGYNLLFYLADFSNVTRQGLNGPIWALIALNSNPAYTIPVTKGVSRQTTEKVLIDHLLSKILSDGGWALTGETANVDITAMAIQALAPYYHKTGYEQVTTAIDGGIACLSNLQSEATGGFKYMGAENSESCVQVLVALCSVGIDPQADPRFQKAGGGVIENLLSFHIKNSGFMHVKAGAQNNGGGEAGAVNGMATEQGFYALAAYTRLLEGKTPLYDMSDVTLKKGGTIKLPTGNDTENDDKNNSSSGNNNENDPSTNNNSSKNSGSSSTTKKPSGTTKKASGTIKTSGAQSSNSHSGGNSGGGSQSSGGTSNDSSDHEASETSEASEVSDTSEVSETSEASETEEPDTDPAGGWSFSGEDYVPETSDLSETEDTSVPRSVPDNLDSPSAHIPLWLAAVGFLVGIIAGGSGMGWFLKKRSNT